MGTNEFDAWSVGQSYEHYMGRWSRQIAARFLDWLKPPPDADWLDVGCGTGALTEAVLAKCRPRSILAVDPSGDFIAYARAALPDPRVRFAAANALSLPADSGTLDVVGAALVLNFVPDRRAALYEAQRVLKPRGLLGFYVWDYPGGGMGLIDAFWKAATEIDAKAADLDEGKRFPFCTRDGLRGLCEDASLGSVVVEPIEIDVAFATFEDLWEPFTLGVGPAPGYCASLGPDMRAALKAALAWRVGTDGPIRLGARAWAARARRPV